MPTDRQPPDDSWTNFALGVFRLNALLIEAGEQISGALGQSSARWQVLGRAFTPQTVAQLARDIGHARQSVQRVADVLEAEGLVRYTDHPDDRRTKLVELTAEGQAVLEAIYVRQLAWSARAMTALDEGTVIHTSTALNAIANTLTTVIANPEGKNE